MEDSVKQQKLRELFTQPEVTSWRALVMTYRMIFSILESRLQKHDYTISRMQVLIALYFDGPTVPVRLANRMMVTRGNISTLLKRMQDEGLIEPTSEKGSESRPAYKLTGKGLDDFNKIYPEHAANIKDLMPQLDAETLKTLLTIQEQIYKKYKVGVPSLFKNFKR